MAESDVRHSLSTQILGSLMALVLLALACLVLLGHDAIRLADTEAVARQERLAARALQAERARLPEQQRSATVWDDAVLRLRAGDGDWLDANLGAWMHDYFGHDAAFILDPADRPVFASVAGQRRPAADFDRHAAAIGPLVTRLRAELAALDAPGGEPDAAPAALAVVEPLRLGEGSALVSVVPILPDTDAVTQPPGTAHLHVALRELGPGLARRIGDPIELTGARFTDAPPAGTGLPLRDAAGATVAWLTWQADRPGMALLKRLLPVILIYGLAGAALLWWMVRRLLRVSTQLHVSEAQARFLAHHDALTGLPNRALFQDRLRDALQQAGRSGRPLALVSIDLDDFKQVNDTLGHPAGDELIRQVASRLSAMLRAGDTVARFGGDEFMLLLPDMGEDAALRDFCGGIIDALSQPYSLLGSSSSISASAGAVRAVSADQDQSDLLRRADIALYNAKAAGRGRLCLFEEDETGAAESRNRLEGDLRAALSGEMGLTVVYQPVHDIEGGVIGAEALCRWTHPSLGALSPEIFIRVAEERGLIDALGAWVLDRACDFAARSRLPRIAVNVSPLQLRNPGFVPMVLATLDRTGLPPERLELELTERAVLDRTRQIHGTLARLRAAGIRIALDDFATGNSSLQYLRDHHVDCVKIDRTFIARLGEDAECDDLVRAIIAMARAMKLSVTVEGVETENQRQILEAMGCRSFQGYLMHAPLAGEQLAALLGDTRPGASPAAAGVAAADP